VTSLGSGNIVLLVREIFHCLSRLESLSLVKVPLIDLDVGEAEGAGELLNLLGAPQGAALELSPKKGFLGTRE